jgi:hypothetical protein
MKNSRLPDLSQSRGSSLPVREFIQRSTQDAAEERASYRPPSSGISQTLASIQSSRQSSDVQPYLPRQLSRLKSLEQALSEEIQEERVAAEGDTPDITPGLSSSLFSRFKDRFGSAKDALHQKFSPTYRAQVATAIEFVQYAQMGPSSGREFSLPVLNLFRGDPDQQIQRLHKANGSLKPYSPVLFVDRIQLLGAGYVVIGIQSMSEAVKKDSASGPCLCMKGDGKRVIFTHEGQRVKSSQERDRLLEEFQRALQERPAEVPVPQRQAAVQQATTVYRPSVKNANVTGALNHAFLEDIERISQSAGLQLFHNLEGKLRIGGLSRAMEQVYDAFQRQGLDDNIRPLALSAFSNNDYHKALSRILQTQSSTVEMSIQKSNNRTPLLDTDQLNEAVDRPVVFQHVGNNQQESEERISTRRFALKLKPESYGDAAALSARLLQDFPDLVDAIKLFPPRQTYSRQDSLVVYLKNDAPSARSAQFNRLVEELSDAGIDRAVTGDERIPGMQQVGATGIYYVDNPPLVSAEDSIPGAMPPFDNMGSQAPGGSHGRFMALVVIASNMLAAREQIPLNEAVQKVWQFAWSVPSRDVTTPQSRQ